MSIIFIKKEKILENEQLDYLEKKKENINLLA